MDWLRLPIQISPYLTCKPLKPPLITWKPVRAETAARAIVAKLAKLAGAKLPDVNPARAASPRVANHNANEEEL